MLEWIYAHEGYAWYLGIMSLVSFVVTLVLVPIFVVRIPEDYFSSPERHPLPWATVHPLLRYLLLFLKNLLGLVFFVFGVLMLLLPGQGMLTIIVAIFLLDFPGKYRFEKWLVSRGTVFRAINWLRLRANKPLLVINELC